MSSERTEPRRLIVVVPDRLSELSAKGEVTRRYYNPGDLFDEVHLVMTNDDRPDLDAIAPMAGRAELVLHNLELPSFKRTLGWRPRLLRAWAAPAVELAASIRPRLVRCHGAHLNTIAAAEIKRALDIPYVVSLHINPDEDVRSRAHGRERLEAEALRSVERVGLRNADLVLPVYEPIVPFLRRIGVSRYQVAYNVLNGDTLHRKADYTLHEPAKVISVGRQLAEKNPVNLVRAVAARPGMTLTLVGDGPAHDCLAELAGELAPDRIELLRSVDNDALCELLSEHDLFATHSEYWEISKSVLEALLTGLPTVLNRRRGDPVPELTDHICVLVDDTPEGFGTALDRLVADDAAREALGRAAGDHAWREWGPPVTERRYADIYRELADLQPDPSKAPTP
jgi:glycosyltransferase involved in cell wall biosynthesis